MREKLSQRFHGHRTNSSINIGINVEKPKESCRDNKCPFHGSLKIRGRSFSGLVVTTDLHKSVTVEWERKFFIAKYERYEKRRSRVRAHNPSCINAKEGDLVTIHECRPLSKTKHFVIIEKTGKDTLFKLKKEFREEAKVTESTIGQLSTPPQKIQAEKKKVERGE